MTYNISIGILAYNEAPKIAKTLASLRQQSIFYLNQDQYRVEVVLVPNGFGANSRSTLRQHLCQFLTQNVANLLAMLRLNQPRPLNPIGYHRSIQLQMLGQLRLGQSLNCQRLGQISSGEPIGQWQVARVGFDNHQMRRRDPNLRL
jgi:hypothetical protein